MVQINFARKEINCKLVYYGPGLSGKTTNLEKVHEKTPEANKGELTSISTDGDRTLFFDFMPLDLGEVAGMKTKFHLYTVPGQVYYNSTRKLVLLGADGVIFVADSTPGKMEENVESLENLRENLAEMGKDIARFPIVFQWNKRDVEGAVPVEELEEKLNLFGAPSFEAVASEGKGVFATLKALSRLVLESIDASSGPPSASAAAPSAEQPEEDRPSGEERGEPLAIERGEVEVPRRGPARQDERESEPHAKPEAPLERAGRPVPEETSREAQSEEIPAGASVSSAPDPAPRAPAPEPAAQPAPNSVAVAPAAEETERQLAARMQRAAVQSPARRDDTLMRGEVRVIGTRRKPRRRFPAGKVAAAAVGLVALAALARLALMFMETR